MKPYEKSKIGNMNILKNEENQDLSDLGYTKNDFEEEKIEEKENIIIKLDSNTEKINQSQNNTSTSPFLSTNNINLKDDYTINDNIKIKKENNNKETNINKKENEESSKMKTININEEKNEKETNRTINKEEEKEKEKEELQNNIITNKTEKKSSKRLISAKRLDSVLLEKPIETTAGSLLQDIRKIYKFKEVLGGGHFGTVRVAYKRKEEPRRYYAIKSISKKNLSPSDLEDLIKEVDIISGLDHPVIIDFYETYQDEFFFHIVMELCKGKEVFQKIASEGKIEEKKVAIVINKVLNAIAYCHSRGITHRDIKPENILFETNEQNSEIKLIDFGLSRKYSVDQKMHTILGTPYYIAPEVLKGNYDEKCDIWSIGALTYIMLSGEPPFKGKSNNEIFMKIIKDPIKFNPYKWNNLSENSKNFIKLCLNKDPQKRPNAVEALGHVWFNSIEISSPKNITQDILNNIKNFSIKQQFKKIVLRYILSTLNETELKKYKRAFYAIDFKHNGTISKEELKRAFEIGKIEITDDNINKVFKLCDENQKGSLDYTDFLMCAYDKKYLLTDKKLNLAFQYFDVDNSGIIEIHDVKDAMLRFGKNVVDSDDTKKLIMEITKDENVDSIILEQFIQMFNK
jgi:calcium-dependent protein kinase